MRKLFVIQIYNLYRLTFVSPSFVIIYMKLEHPLIGMAIRKCLFKYCQERHYFLVGCPAILASRVTKRQIQLPCLPWICLMPRLVYPTLILNISSANISFPLGKMIGMVRSWIRQSWEIGSPPTCSAGRMKFCVVPISAIHMWLIHTS